MQYEIMGSRGKGSSPCANRLEEAWTTRSPDIDNSDNTEWLLYKNLQIEANERAGRRPKSNSCVCNLVQVVNSSPNIWTLQGHFVIEGCLPWAAGRSFPLWSPNTGGGGGGGWWSCWNSNMNKLKAERERESYLRRQQQHDSEFNIADAVQLNVTSCWVKVIISYHAWEEWMAGWYDTNCRPKHAKEVQSVNPTKLLLELH